MAGWKNGKHVAQWLTTLESYAMPYSDVPAFIARLRERSSPGRLALEALILAAARSGEVRLARWSEVDLDNALWSIPAERMKMGKAQVVPLPAAALDVFRRASALKLACSDLVFPGQKPTRTMSDMTLLKVLRDMGLPFTVNGFRSAFRDWAAERTDFPGEVAEAALAHSVSNRATTFCFYLFFPMVHASGPHTYPHADCRLELDRAAPYWTRSQSFDGLGAPTLSIIACRSERAEPKQAPLSLSQQS